VSKNAIAVQPTRVTVSDAASIRPVAKVIPTRVRNVPDPDGAAERNREVQVICAARNDGIPEVPGLCKAATTPSRPKPAVVRDHRTKSQ
jgi:hypothetical protein